MTTFRGATYEASLDSVRLGKQLKTVAALMLDGRWRTLRDVATTTGYPEASVSARLRDLRKRDYLPGVTLESRRIQGGLWRYRLVPQSGYQQQDLGLL
jgi:hypothetical protein